MEARDEDKRGRCIGHGLQNDLRVVQPLPAPAKIRVQGPMLFQTGRVTFVTDLGPLPIPRELEGLQLVGPVPAVLYHREAT